jgi:hypothetical protein
VPPNPSRPLEGFHSFCIVEVFRPRLDIVGVYPHRRSSLPTVKLLAELGSVAIVGDLYEGFLLDFFPADLADLGAALILLETTPLRLR